MKRLPAFLAAILMAAPAIAQDDPFVTFKVLKPEIALRAAVAAMENCRAQGYQVGVSVVDRFGLPQVFIRDQLAGNNVPETAFRKAWTAVSFRQPTLALADATQPGTPASAIRDLSMPLALGGGVPIESAGSVVGGIGVSGAPQPEFDDACARAGIDAIEDEIGF